MSAIPETSDPPAPSADSLLNQLVQEHLARADVATGANPNDSPLTSPDASPQPAPEAVLLSNMPPAEAGANDSPPTVTVAPLSEAAIAIAAPAAAPATGAEPAMSAADLDALLSSDAQALVESDKESSLSSAATPLPVDVPSEVDPSDVALAEELAKLCQADVEKPSNHRDDTPPVDPSGVAPTQVEAAAMQTVPETTAAVGSPGDEPDIAGAVDVPPSPPLEGCPAPTAPSAPEAVTNTTPGKRPTFGANLMVILRDLLLIVAQALDAPFAKLPEETKNLIAIAGLLMLSSGIALVVFGMLRH
jgi:hypothetical protein